MLSANLEPKSNMVPLARARTQHAKNLLRGNVPLCEDAGMMPAPGSAVGGQQACLSSADLAGFWYPRACPYKLDRVLSSTCLGVGSGDDAGHGSSCGSGQKVTSVLTNPSCGIAFLIAHNLRSHCRLPRQIRTDATLSLLRETLVCHAKG